MAAVWLASGRKAEHRQSPGDVVPGLVYVYEVVGADASKEAVQTCWNEFYDRAVAVLERRWSAVEAVAAALMAETVIDRKRLRGLVDGAQQ
jgi:hypothetical protein